MSVELAGKAVPAVRSCRALIVARDPVAHERFCGRTLVDRHEAILRRAGVCDVQVTRDRDAVARHCPASTTPGCPGDAERHAGGRVLVVAAERVFDPRLYKAALDHTGPVVITDRGHSIGLEVLDGDRPAAQLEIDSIDPYSRELRRTLRPFWMRIEGTAECAAVRRVLVAASAKGRQDLPSMLINRPAETAIMLWLAETGITPNQITIVCNVLAYVVAILLATGHLLAGAVGGMAVGILDGLDGRQARIQVKTSRLGRIEHLLDKVYEIAWMVALAYALSSGFSDVRYTWELAAWTVAYLLDSAAYDLFRWRRGLQLDEATRVDGAIRLIAGRRNIYVCILLAGVLLGEADGAFHVIVWWAVVTTAVHWIRVVMLLAAARVAPLHGPPEGGHHDAPRSA